VGETEVSNPYFENTFLNSDEDLAELLCDVSIPALLCSLVHMTGDTSWIRGKLKPAASIPNDYQSGIPEEECQKIREAALPIVSSYRDQGLGSLIGQT